MGLVVIRSGVIWVRKRAYELLIFHPFLHFAHNDRSLARLGPMDRIVLIFKKKYGLSWSFGSPPRNLYLGGSRVLSVFSFVSFSPCTMVCDNWVGRFSLWEEGIACTKWMGWDGVFFLPGITFLIIVVFHFSPDLGVRVTRAFRVPRLASRIRPALPIGVEYFLAWHGIERIWVREN